MLKLCAVGREGGREEEAHRECHKVLISNLEGSEGTNFKMDTYSYN